MVVQINMKLPSLNDYIKVCRANKYMAAKFKANIEQEIGFYLTQIPKIDNPIQIHFHWVEGNKKRDLDNVCFAKKFILDAMVKYGKLKDDNRKCVTGFTDTFGYGDETRVMMTIKEVK